MAAGRLRLPLATLDAAGLDPASLLREPMPAALPPLLAAEKSALQSRLAALPARLDRTERATQRQGLVLAALHQRLLAHIDHRTTVARTRAEVPPWSKMWTAWRIAVRHG
jgi:phytoene/squalene synthetase